MPSLSSYRYRPSPGSRLTALALSLAICALIVLMLIRMGMLGPGSGHGAERLVAISLQPQQAERTEHRATARAVHAAARPQTARPVPRPVPKPSETVPPLHLLKLTPEQFAAADISKMPRRQSEDSPDDKSDQGSAAAYGPGEGPGGARLYNAQWYREPTHAELVTYMPHRDVAGGWAMIACKTQDHFRVDDCRELGESPPGSGLARALRLASWQFLVRPPRLEGKPLLGAWVRIRFDFTRATGEGADAPSGG